MTEKKVKESLSESDFMSNSGTQITSTEMRVNQLQFDSWRAYMNTMQCIPLQCTSRIEQIYIHWTWHFPPSKLLSIVFFMDNTVPVYHQSSKKIGECWLDI